ncbi:DNA-binding transcriptional MerR regulator [Streptosporangium becharense]|uniref:DNA-binding transcriptional MerR regulator n=1 Tax=Streptosporangium becharense TaxID=1816182 RepID=A0A7W9IDI1_9ACTN|nr:MerR family transcriptional regulator [Streptosporangium becharense]MBB2912904.1 DNA-binding transcriptional MerR regulator [Streptosporangium becharense]MBB5818271.1 DNA-binding transcriptional MerR regulator [Streptosporangium becharense]
MAELSRVTGVSVPMIKYYLREGLLPAGERTGPNQARYGPEHVRRLKLVRAMAEYGGLSLASIATLLEQLERPELSLHDRLGVAQRTVTPRHEPGEGERWDLAARQARELIARHGWHHHSDSEAMRAVAGVLFTLGALGYDGVLTRLDEYAEAAARTARADVAALMDEPDLERMVELVVVGTLLGDTLIAALRRIAQGNISAGALGQKLQECRAEPGGERPGGAGGRPLTDTGGEGPER